MLQMTVLVYDINRLNKTKQKKKKKKEKNCFLENIGLNKKNRF